MTIIDGSLASTVAALAAIRDPQARLNAFTGGIVARGGSVILPADGGNWGPHLVEFSYHGVLGQGATAEEALASWTRAATRLVEGLHDARGPVQ